MKTTVIYHSADFDGIFCREVSKHFLGTSDVEYIGWDYKDKPLKFPESGMVYVLDLPVDRVFGFDDFSKNKVYGTGFLLNRVIWIDHHKTSIETHPTDILGYRIDGVAACRLAWQYFSIDQHNAQNARNEQFFLTLPTKEQFINRDVLEPYAVRLAGEYDIWDKRDHNAETFQFGLRSRELNAETWRCMLQYNQVKEGDLLSFPKDGGSIPSTVAAMLDDGALLQEYQRSIDRGAMERSFLVEWEGLKFLCLNSIRFNSLTFSSKDVPKTGHDALMGFYYDGARYIFSLYHARHNTGIDLSAIAKKHGGGGHRGACGFILESIPFL